MRRILTGGFITVSIVLASCAKENEPYGNSFDFGFKGAGPQCLSDAPDKVHRYFNGALKSEKEIREFFSCFRQALAIFRKYVKGNESGTYRAVELREFMHQFFLGDIRISDALLTEFMELKRLLVGGTNSSFKSSDFEKLDFAIGEFETIFIELYPHIKVFSGPDSKSNIDLSPIAEFDASLEVINNISLKLGRLIQGNGIGYQFSNLERFLLELSKLFEKDHRQSNLARLQQYVPLVKILKSSFIAPGADGIGPHQWVTTFSKVSELLAIWLRIEHYVSRSDWRQGMGLEQVSLVFHQVKSFLKSSLSDLGKSALSHQEAFALIEEFGKMHSLPLGFTTSEAQQIWQTLVDRLVANQSTVQGLTSEKIDFIEQEFLIWQKFQQLAIEHAASPVYSEGEIRRNASDDVAAAEFQRIVLNAPWPIPQDSYGRVRIGHQVKNAPMDFLTLSELNWQRAAIRLLILAYSKDPKWRSEVKGLKGGELKTAYMDLRSALVAIGLIDSTDETFYSRVQQEANLFVPRSNGDSIVDFEEGVEYLYYVLSGISAGKYLKADMKPVCGLKEEGLYDTACFRKRFRDNFLDYGNHLPGLINYVSTLDNSQWTTFEKHLERTIRKNGYDPSPISTGDVTEMLILLQYIETFISRFDIDRSETINKKESLIAEPIFHATLKDLVDINLGDWFITSVFTWMMKTGAPPKTDFFSLIEFGFWTLNPSSWKYEANRTTLASILSSLAEKRRNSKNKSLAEEFKPIMALSLPPEPLH